MGVALYSVIPAPMITLGGGVVVFKLVFSSILKSSVWVYFDTFTGCDRMCVLYLMSSPSTVR